MWEEEEEEAEEKDNRAGAGLLPGSQGGQAWGSTPAFPSRGHPLLQTETIVTGPQ